MKVHNFIFICMFINQVPKSKYITLIKTNLKQFQLSINHCLSVLCKILFKSILKIKDKILFKSILKIQDKILFRSILKILS